MEIFGIRNIGLHQYELFVPIALLSHRIKPIINSARVICYALIFLLPIVHKMLSQMCSQKAAVSAGTPEIVGAQLVWCY